MTERLDRAFFEGELARQIEAYSKENNGQRVFGEVMLRDGSALRMEGDPVCSDGFVRFDYKRGTHMRRILVPYGAIVGISLVVDSAGTLGFQSAR